MFDGSIGINHKSQQKKQLLIWHKHYLGIFVFKQKKTHGVCFPKLSLFEWTHLCGLRFCSVVVFTRLSVHIIHVCIRACSRCWYSSVETLTITRIDKRFLSCKIAMCMWEIPNEMQIRKMKIGCQIDWITIIIDDNKKTAPRQYSSKSVAYRTAEKMSDGRPKNFYFNVKML